MMYHALKTFNHRSDKSSEFINKASDLTAHDVLSFSHYGGICQVNQLHVHLHAHLLIKFTIVIPSLRDIQNTHCTSC